MAVCVDALSFIASIVKSGFSRLKDATAGYAHAVEKDTQTNGLIA
jgi:hypothetical protein